MKEKVVLITGGCSGLGKELASIFKEENTVIIVSNDTNELEKTSKDLGVESYFCDITNVLDIEKVLNTIIEKYKKVDVLINNAGVLTGGKFEDTSYSDIAKVMLVNAVGTMNMTKAVIPFMKKVESGIIVNIGSVDGIHAKKERSVYCASKFAITAFTETIREELKEDGIRVFGIFPGLIKTNLHKSAGVERDFTNAMDPSDVAKLIRTFTDFDDISFDCVVFKHSRQ